MLLTSIAFGIAAVTLARRKVLVQELPAVEGLARVDVVCLDKTGTLTEGDIVFDRLELLDPARADRRGDVTAALGALADDENRNATLGALGERLPGRRAGRAPVRCRSRRRASGARRASTATARG